MPAVILALTSALLASGPPPAAQPPARVSIVAACSAAAPAPGAVLSGPVLQVMDGQTLCIAQGPTPDRWIQVRLEGMVNPGARSALMAASFAKDVVCNVERRNPEGVVGRCAVDGAPLDELVESGSIRAQAAAWR